MERRNRERLKLGGVCRVTPATSGGVPTWKRIENISGAGVFLVWSEEDAPTPPPSIGSLYVAELELPEHPVFGQRALELDLKAVRVVRKEDGRVMAAFAAVRRRFKELRPGAPPSDGVSDWVN